RDSSADRRHGAGDPSLHALEVAARCEGGSPQGESPEGTATGAGPRDRTAPGSRAEIRRAPRGARPPKKSHPVLGRSKSDRFAFIDTLVTQYEGHKVAPL